MKLAQTRAKWANIWALATRPEFRAARRRRAKRLVEPFEGPARRPLLLPKDDKSGCTAEAIAFNALRDKFDAAGVVVVGVSPDSAASHAKFKRKHDLSLTLAADDRRRRSDPMASGGKRACTAGNTWGSSARLPNRRQGPRRAGVAQGGKFPATPRTFLPWPRRCERRLPTVNPNEAVIARWVAPHVRGRSVWAHVVARFLSAAEIASVALFLLVARAAKASAPSRCARSRSGR